MLFLADENIPGPVVRQLRNNGYNELWIRESCPGITDEEVLKKADDENRVLLTFDKDFGEMAHLRGLSSRKGIILFRLSTKNSEETSKIILKILSAGFDWAGNFSVATEKGIRSFKC